MTPLTDRLAAAVADRYRIERELGAGGMATVYLAVDLKHDRRVAIKVLKPELAAVLGAERFVQEIKTTAALSHPHILPLFDSGEAGGFLFYVMPFIEGETIRERLNRETQLGVDEAVRIAVEVADALDYAHRHGVIHRDIKPENILLHDGRPMVMDFGIALAVSAAAGGRMTETGLSLGTPHYMSPEQATAERDITARSDIYSLASVLYEMLAGHPPHTGSTVQQIILKIISETAAPVTQFRRTVPEQVALALGKALEKVPADRFATAAEFSAAIQGHLGLRSAGHAGVAASTRAPARSRREAGLLALAAVGFVVAAWALASRGAGAPRERVEFAFRLGRGVPDRPQIEISRDGRLIAGVVRDSLDAGEIAVRDLGSTEVRRIAGTTAGEFPRFSPSGASLAFVAHSAAYRVPAAGGAPIKVADSSNVGLTWIGEEELLVSGEYRGLFRVSANGGPATPVTTLDTARREFAHWMPQLLPGGKVVIFNSFSTPLVNSRVEAVELATGRRTVLVEGAVAPRYVPSGHLLFVRDRTLFAIRFDPGRLAVSGAAVPVVEDVAWAFTDGAGGYAVSDNGTLVYLKASEWSVNRRLVWVDRAGNERSAIDAPGQWAEPRLSPDGRWIAVTRLDEGRQIWLHDQRRGVLAQLTRTAGVAFNAVWTPDSRAIVASVETPVYDLWRFAIDGSRTDTLVATPIDKYATGFAPDGRTLLYHILISGNQLRALALGEGAPTSVAAPAGAARNATYSPDGRWVAFEEVRPTGQTEVVVVRAAAGGEAGGAASRRQVSAGGGGEPRWTKGGRELVYRNGFAVMAVAFDPATGEPATPVELFSKVDQGRLTNRTLGYDVTPDGREFLMALPVERREALPVIVVTNWFEELERKVPR